MIKTENLFLESLCIDLGDRSVKAVIYKENAHSVGELLEVMKKYPDLDWKRAKSLIKRANNIVKKSNANGKEAEIYIPQAYSDSRLLATDKDSYAADLILQSPTSEGHCKYYSLNNKTIEDIKRDIVLTDSRGVNALKSSNSDYRNIGSAAILKIVKALDFYREQVERQAKIYDDWSNNLFYEDYLEKEQIVKDLYSEIVLFFAYHSESRTVWGDLSDEEKKKIVSSAINDKEIDRIIREKLFNDITLYTTLPELEDLSNNNQNILKRFLVK